MEMEVVEPKSENGNGCGNGCGNGGFRLPLAMPLEPKSEIPHCQCLHPRGSPGISDTGEHAPGSSWELDFAGRGPFGCVSSFFEGAPPMFGGFKGKQQGN